MKIQALMAKYHAERLEALATLEVYMTNSVGIGEHPQIVEEMDKLITKLADAEGKIEVLKKHISNDNPQTGANQPMQPVNGAN